MGRRKGDDDRTTNRESLYEDVGRGRFGFTFSSGNVAVCIVRKESEKRAM